jgi:hypothetical protein
MRIGNYYIVTGSTLAELTLRVNQLLAEDCWQPVGGVDVYNLVYRQVFILPYYSAKMIRKIKAKQKKRARKKRK